ncbi:MAG: signal peptidase I [Clostridia bacterium]
MEDTGRRDHTTTNGEQHIKTSKSAIIAEIIDERITQGERRKDWKRFLIELIVIVFVICVLFRWILGIAVVNGSSMEPTLINGDVVVFNRLISEYNVGDVVVITKQGVVYVKRIIARKGDIVDFTDSGRISVNGSIIDEQYTLGKTYRTEAAVSFPVVVEKGFFVLGDNRENSQDSRGTRLGQLDKGQLIGKALWFFRIGTI